MYIQASMRQSCMLLAARAGSSANGFSNVLPIFDILWDQVLSLVGEN
jgi:hypothetical protein